MEPSARPAASRMAPAEGAVCPGTGAAAGTHGLQQGAGVFRQQDKHRGGRFLQDLEQGVLRRGIHPVGPVDDKDLEGALVGGNEALPPQLAHLVDEDVSAFGVKEKNIRMGAGCRLHAGRADAAGTSVFGPA